MRTSYQSEVSQIANFTFNISKCRVTEFYNRVKSNDPAASVLFVIPIETSGLESQVNLEDSVSMTEVLDGTTNPQATMGNKTLADADLAALPSPNFTDNSFELDLPDITWTAATGNAISALVVAYSSDGAGALTTAIPMTYHDFVVTPDGSDIVATTTKFFDAA